MVLCLFKQKSLSKQFHNCYVPYSDTYGTAQTAFKTNAFSKNKNEIDILKS